MKMRTLFTYLFVIMALSIYADDYVKDAEPAILEVYYTRIEINDTTKRDKHFMKDQVMLRIGKNKSLFCGTQKLWVDSLKAVNPELEWQMYRATMEANRQNDTHNLPGGYYWSYIYKNYPEGCVTERRYFDGDRHIYEEEWEKPQWEITDSVKTVIGYECFKAVCNYRGREWTAWFAPEIPIQDGPWKLCGLPGLILEAYDSHHDYSFTATGLRQNGIPPVGYMSYDDRRGLKKQARDKFFNDLWKYRNSNFGAKMNAIHGNGKMPDTEDSAPKSDAEETNYPHDL